MKIPLHWRDCIDHIKKIADGNTIISPNAVAKKYSCGAPLAKTTIDLFCEPTEKVGRGSKYLWIGPDLITRHHYETIVNEYRKRQKGWNQSKQKEPQPASKSNEFDPIDVAIKMAKAGMSDDLIKFVVKAIK